MNRIVKRSLIVLAVLTGTPVILIMCFLVWLLTYTYWTADTKFGGGLRVSEFTASKNALGFKKNHPFSLGYCDLDKPSLDNPSCMDLDSINRGVCHWWFAETCQPYQTSRLILGNPEALGKMFHAIIDPCLYTEDKAKKQKFDWCWSNMGFYAEKRQPVVVIFKKDSETEALRIRIDFPEGFTTPTREELIKIGDD